MTVGRLIVFYIVKSKCIVFYLCREIYVIYLNWDNITEQRIKSLDSSFRSSRNQAVRPWSEALSSGHRAEESQAVLAVKARF